MLDKNILEAIEDGTISSRRQVYDIVGRTKKLRLWMDDNNILVPSKWTQERVVTKLRDSFERNGRIPVAQDDWNLARAAQNHFGSWNNAVFAAFGQWNQRRYTSFSQQDIIQMINDYVDKYGHYPLREEFDGRKYPYWEAVEKILQVDKWSEVLALAKPARHLKHGWGSRQFYDGQLFLSRQELLIAKWLVSNNIKYDKEVPYSKYLNYLFDFYLPEYDVYIEYYGLGTKEYLDRVKEKRKHYAGRKVIEIFKHENTIGKLAQEVQRLQSLPE